jgi:hypothetical protein
MLDSEWLNSFAAVGLLSGGAGAAAQWRPIGASVLVAEHGLTWLVTANHVLPSEPSPRVAVRVDVYGDPTLVNIWEIQTQTPGLHWVRDAEHDLAACLLPNLPGARVRSIPREFWAANDMELTSMTCVIGGCPLGLPGLDPTRAMPIVLDGIVAGMDRTAQRIYVTAPTYPGNSGGPIFVERPWHNASGGGTIGGGPTTFLAGVVLQTGKIEASGYTERLHLGVAAHISQVADLLDTVDAHQQAVIARGAG